MGPLPAGGGLLAAGLELGAGWSFLGALPTAGGALPVGALLAAGGLLPLAAGRSPRGLSPRASGPVPMPGRFVTAGLLPAGVPLTAGGLLLTGKRLLGCEFVVAAGAAGLLFAGGLLPREGTFWLPVGAGAPGRSPCSFLSRRNLPASRSWVAGACAG